MTDTLQNSVSIDEDQVKAELAELAGGPLGADPSAAGPGGPGEVGAPPAPAPPPMDWTLVAGGLVHVVDKIVMPNWQLATEEKDLLFEQTKITFSVFFPNVNIDPRVQAILALGGTLVVIAGKRFDLQTQRLRPLRVKPAVEEGTDAAGEDRAPA